MRCSEERHLYAFEGRKTADFPLRWVKNADSVRANPATSAPSYICETWRNVAQTCLIIKEMGPERSRINVADPIYISFQRNQMS